MTTEPPTPTPEEELRAEVRPVFDELWVTNASPDNWWDCRIEVNPGFLRGGWERSVDGLPAGETYHLPLRTFTKADGTRFDPLTTAVRRVAIHCSTPRGRQHGFWSA